METYYGQVRTPQDAILLFEACRMGLLPRVQRRLSEKERRQIRSGSVFVWDEREAGMRRWTDGKSWSASRVSGSFLTYREMEGKRGNLNTQAHNALKKLPGVNNKALEGSRNSDNEEPETEEGEGPDGYRYKTDGLMKQSFSITTQNSRHLHLISYYARVPTGIDLKQPSNDQHLRHIRPQKDMYPDASLNEVTTIPAVTRTSLSGASWAPTSTIPSPQAHYTYNQHSYVYPSHPAHQPQSHQSAYPPHVSPTHWTNNGSIPHYPPHNSYPPQSYSTHHPYYTTPMHHNQNPSPYPPLHSGYGPSAYPTPPNSTLPPLHNGHVGPTGEAPLRSPIASNGYVSLHPSISTSFRPNMLALEAEKNNSPTLEFSQLIMPMTNGHINNSAQTNGYCDRPNLPCSTEANTSLPPSNLPRTTSVCSGAPSNTVTDRIIPSINSILGPKPDACHENGSHTPPNGLTSLGRVQEVADPVSGPGRERDKNDLKRLDSHSLKFN